MLDGRTGISDAKNTTLATGHIVGPVPYSCSIAKASHDCVGPGMPDEARKAGAYTGGTYTGNPLSKLSPILLYTRIMNASPNGDMYELNTHSKLLKSM